MWHLEEPSQEILDWFKNQFLDDMCNSIRINLCKDVLDVLLPNDSQEIIETLMIESPATLYAHNNELEDDLKAKGLWTAENKDKLFKGCPVCNRSIKHLHEFKYGTHLHPYINASETNFRFRYIPLPNNNWDVIMDGCTLEECGTAQIFETEQVYKVHGNMEVKDMVDFAYRNTPQYLDDLYQHVMKAYGGNISPAEAYKVITGTDCTPEKFLDRPLAKLKRDIALQLQETLGD